MDLPPAHFVNDEMQNRRLIVDGLSAASASHSTIIMNGFIDIQDYAKLSCLEWVSIISDLLGEVLPGR